MPEVDSEVLKSQKGVVLKMGIKKYLLLNRSGTTTGWEPPYVPVIRRVRYCILHKQQPQSYSHVLQVHQYRTHVAPEPIRSTVVREHTRENETRRQLVGNRVDGTSD